MYSAIFKDFQSFSGRFMPFSAQRQRPERRKKSIERLFRTSLRQLPAAPTYTQRPGASPRGVARLGLGNSFKSRGPEPGGVSMSAARLSPLRTPEWRGPEARRGRFEAFVAAGG